MKSIKLFAIAMVAVMSFAACQKNEPTPSKPDSKLTLKVRASVYNFTKATDTAFEENDEIGLYMFKGEETYAENHKYTYVGGALTTAADIAWYEETEVVANITAYYPYSENAYNGEFFVNADQSSPELYKASDLLLASAQSAPTENAVVLPFKHALSKVIVSFDNQLNEDIADVYFTDLRGKVTLNVEEASVEATGDAGVIKAFKAGENTWQLIVAPQTASPKLAVTTTSGKQYTFVLEEEVTFSAGKVSTATGVVLSRETIYTSFTPEIEDWVADNELNFSQNDENVELPEEEVVVPNVPAEPELTACKLTIRVNKAITWYDKYLYTWYSVDSNDIKLTGEWPGTKADYDKEDGDYYVYYHNFDASLNGQTINYVVNGDGKQTKDLTVTLNGAETTVTIESTDVK